MRAFEADGASPEVVAVVVPAVKAVAVVVGWICMESLDWLESNATRLWG